MLSISDRGSRSYPTASLWIPLYDNYYFPSIPAARPAPVWEMIRIAIMLRVWLRRAIKRVNEHIKMRIVDMVNWNSLRALYGAVDITDPEHAAYGR